VGRRRRIRRLATSGFLLSLRCFVGWCPGGSASEQREAGTPNNRLQGSSSTATTTAGNSSPPPASTAPRRTGIGPSASTPRKPARRPTGPARGQRHDYAQFEALTGYIPPEFAKFRTFRPSSGELEELRDGKSTSPATRLGKGRGGRRRGVVDRSVGSGHRIYDQGLATSPPARVARARQVCSSIVSAMACTDPPIIATCTTPG